MYIYMDTHIYIHLFVYVHTYARTYASAYIHPPMHARTHTHTRIHTSIHPSILEILSQTSTSLISFLVAHVTSETAGPNIEDPFEPSNNLGSGMQLDCRCSKESIAGFITIDLSM